MIRIDLTKEQKDRLELQHRRERDKRVCDRMKAVLLNAEGWTSKQIGQALRIHETTVTEHLQEFIKFAKLKPENGGSESKLTPAQALELKEHLTTNTYLYIKDICAYVMVKYGVQYSVAGMRSWLINNGFRYKKPHVVPAKANKEAQEFFIKNYEQLLNNMWDNDSIYFADSVHPQHQARPSYGWILKGERKTLPTNSGQKRMHITGAINLENMKVIHVEYDKINAANIINFLQTVDKQTPGNGTITIIFDNASYHRSRDVKLYIEQNKRIKLLYLPPYSPNLNPIERLWKVMHEQVTNNRYYLTFKEFREAIMEFFAKIPYMKEILIDRITDNFAVVNFNNFQAPSD
jgi:transposase